MALKDSKFSHLTRTLTSIPLAGRDGLTTPPEQSEVKLNKPDQPSGDQSSGEQLSGEQAAVATKVAAADAEAANTEPSKWQTRLHQAKVYCSQNGEKIGIGVCIVTALLLIGAVLCSTQSVRHLNKGEQLFQSGDYKKALPEFSSALWFNPNSVAALYQRGGIYSKCGDSKSALADYSKAIKINPFYKDVIERRAAIYAHTGDYRNAIQDYSTALSSSDAPRASLLAGRASAYANVGDYNAAVADYDAAISRAPKNASLYLGRVQCFIKLKRYRDGMHDCDTAAELEPRNPLIYAKRAWCEHFLGKRNEAMKDINLALEIEPSASESYYYRGTFLLREQQFERALADLEQAISLNSKDPRNYLLRGEALSELGQKKRALADLDKALKLEPLRLNDIRPSFVANLGARISIEIGDYKTAAKQLSILIEANPQEAANYIRRARCYMRVGNYTQALADCDAAIGIKSTDATFFTNRALCQAKLGREVSAEHDFEKALSLSPNSAEIYMARGNFYCDRRNFDKAADDFSEAVRINHSAAAKSRLAFALGAAHRGGGMPAVQISQASESRHPGGKDADATPLSSNLNVLLNAGYADLAKGRARKSIEELSRAVQLYPNDVKARRYLAYALLQGREPLGAVEQFKQLGNLGQQTTEDKLVMSDAFIDAGRPKDAVAVCKQCLEQDSANPKIYAKLARGYAMLGFPEKAAEICREGMKHASSAQDQAELEAVRAEISAPQVQAGEAQHSVQHTHAKPPPVIPHDGGG